MDGNRLTGLCIIIFCAILWFAVLPAQTEGGEDTLLPRIGILAMAVPAFILALRGGSKPASLPAASFLRVAVPLFGLSAAYAAAVPAVGFFASSAVFIAAALLLFGEHQPLRVALIPIAVPAAVFAVMRVALSFDLPQGVLL